MQVAMKKGAVERQKRQICAFRINGRPYGIDILEVKEINSEVQFTPIFHAPREVKGYVNIRGQIYLILDLRLLLGFESKEVDAASRLVLLKPESGEPFGVLVDSVDDIVTADEEQLEDRRIEDLGPPEGSERRIALDLVDAVCKLEDELLVILDSGNLLNIIGNL